MDVRSNVIERVDILRHRRYKREARKTRVLGGEHDTFRPQKGWIMQLVRDETSYTARPPRPIVMTRDALSNMHYSSMPVTLCYRYVFGVNIFPRLPASYTSPRRYRQFLCRGDSLTCWRPL
mgnify:CR=1 FL=1